MIVKKEIRLKDFAAWGGGKENLELLIKHNLVDIVENYINEIFPDGINEIILNDILWHGLDDILNDLGYNLDNLL
jgi:hypothetical protein